MDYPCQKVAVVNYGLFLATEFRILIYTDTVIFKNILNDDIYKHFMALDIGMTILLSDYMDNYMEYARSILRYFVQHFETLKILNVVQCSWPCTYQ